MAKEFNKILVTGGTGFLGYNLYQYLRRVDPDLEVWVFSRRTGDDILDYAALEGAVGGKDLVVHLAAQTHVDFSIDGSTQEKQQFIDTNTKGALNTLMACRRHNVKMIHISTSEVYGTSQNPGKSMTENHPLLAQAGVYAVSKAAADLLCRMAFMTEGQDVVIMRPFNMYGPHQSLEKLIPRFINLAMYGEPLTIYGDGEQRRDYLWVQDAADAVWRARNLEAGTIVNIATETSYSINDIAEVIIRACGSKGMKVHTITKEHRPAEVQELNGSYRKLNKLVGWKPVVNLEDGINKCVNWYTANGYIVPPPILNWG
jgi:nucleoside-diphosphate-sugar epimerase